MRCNFLFRRCLLRPTPARTSPGRCYCCLCGVVASSESSTIEVSELSTCLCREQAVEIDFSDDQHAPLYHRQTAGLTSRVVQLSCCFGRQPIVPSLPPVALSLQGSSKCNHQKFAKGGGRADDCSWCAADPVNIYFFFRLFHWLFHPKFRRRAMVARRPQTPTTSLPLRASNAELISNSSWSSGRPASHFLPMARNILASSVPAVAEQVGGVVGEEAALRAVGGRGEEVKKKS